jgi:hypothetical protein
MNKGPNIFDFLTRRHIPYFVSDPDKSERHNLAVLKDKLPEIDFASCIGRAGRITPLGWQRLTEIPVRLRRYEEWIKEVVNAAKAHYGEVHYTFLVITEWPIVTNTWTCEQESTR